MYFNVFADEKGEIDMDELREYLTTYGDILEY